ncbi:ammonium transporter [Spongiactinospora sp. 9N601]|uniref:ammonium transporter n=1 Tax=Spongiactinospora sp. 9N601 TaxID=3375149 RepID=UPI0037ADF017
MLFMAFVSISLVTVLWFAFGYGIVFGPDAGGLGLIGFGDPRFAGITPSELHGSVPTHAFALFQLTFAIITVALISGSVAGRVRLGPWILFSILWVLLVYFPVAHWVFAPSGWLSRWGVLDFAGGLVVELNSGMSGLALAIALGYRRGRPPVRMRETEAEQIAGSDVQFGQEAGTAGPLTGVAGGSRARPATGPAARPRPPR